MRNVLLIPKIGVDGLVYESEDPVVLNYGIWRRPQTSTPDRGGNTVFVAHRYLYTTGINTFYHLPKMEVGDQFFVYWQQKQYTYEVFTVDTVLPTEIEIEENTEEPIVTLYTCTPLWTSEYRLVVRARLIEEPQT
jgi:sortase A